MTDSVSVLLVCHANICRSPLAEGVFRHVAGASGFAERFVFDSAGTYAIEGAPPHPYSVEVGRRHGIAIAGRARQILRRDLDGYDHVLVMDRANLRELTALAAPSAFGPLDGYRARIELVRVAAGTSAGDPDVPDPIGSDVDAYEHTYGLLHAAAEALVRQLS